MLLISIILNLITILIVLGFIVIVYLSYRQRPNLSATPLDVMRDIIGGQSGHARVYKVTPYKNLLIGPMGNFDGGTTPGNEINLATIDGNSYDYVPRSKPWENVDDISFGSRTGIPVGGNDLYIRRKMIQDLEDGKDGFTPTELQKSLLDTLKPNDDRFSYKLEQIKTLDPTDPSLDLKVRDIKSS